MGMQNPNVDTFEPTDKLSEVFPEGTPFFLTGIRTVKAKTNDYGEGEMVLITVQGHPRELGIWGAYLLAQAKSVTGDDLGQWYTINRKLVAGFGKNRPVKVFEPVDPPTAPAGDSRVSA